MEEMADVVKPTPPKAPRRTTVKYFDVVQVKQDYQAANGTELSFEEGQILTVLEKGDDFWLCKYGAKQGLVPVRVLRDSPTIDAPLSEAARRGKSCRGVIGINLEYEECLHVMVGVGNIALLKELVMTGMSVNTLDSAGNCPLYWSCRGGHLDCVKILLAAKPALTQQVLILPRVDFAFKQGGHPEVMKLLLKQPGIEEIVSWTNHQGLTARELARNIDCAAVLQDFMNPAMPPDAMADDDQDSD